MGSSSLRVIPDHVWIQAKKNSIGVAEFWETF